MPSCFLVFWPTSFFLGFSHVWLHEHWCCSVVKTLSRSWPSMNHCCAYIPWEDRTTDSCQKRDSSHLTPSLIHSNQALFKHLPSVSASVPAQVLCAGSIKALLFLFSLNCLLQGMQPHFVAIILLKQDATFHCDSGEAAYHVLRAFCAVHRGKFGEPRILEFQILSRMTCLGGLETIH